MSDFRTLLDLMESLDTEPEIGDGFALEFGDELLVETEIIELDSEALILEADDFLWQYLTEREMLSEAKYKGRTVSLGKPFLTPDGPKKRSVYVKNDKGNVVKVNFGSKEMRIKKSNPARRKSFRARHNCKNPGPRWKARYWSCKFW